MNPLPRQVKTAFTTCLLIFLFIGIKVTFAQYKVGDKVTDFTLVDVNGKAILLSDYKGKVILLNFFTSHG